MILTFHPEAEREFNEAIEYYESCEPGLGLDFSVEVRTTLHTILRYPDAWPIISEDVHRCLVNRFPYGILYSIEGSEIFVLAVMHLRRHPEYWGKR